MGLLLRCFFPLGFQQYGHGFFMSFWISRFYQSKKYFLFYSSQDPSRGGALGSIRHRKNVEKIILNRRKIWSKPKPHSKLLKPINFPIPLIKTQIDPMQLVTIVAHWGFAVTRDQWRRMIAAQIEEKSHRVPNRTTH